MRGLEKMGYAETDESDVGNIKIQPVTFKVDAFPGIRPRSCEPGADELARAVAPSTPSTIAKFAAS
jgi:hypothetical protein